MTRIKIGIAAAAFAIAGIAGTAPAGSSTCAIADPDLEDVVCGVVTTVGPFVGPLCEGKYEICLMHPGR